MSSPPPAASATTMKTFADAMDLTESELKQLKEEQQGMTVPTPSGRNGHQTRGDT